MNSVYHFHGCFYHGCATCFEPSDFNSVTNEKFFTLHEKTQRFTQMLLDNMYNVVEKWECEYRKEVKLTEKALCEKKKQFYSVLLLNPLFFFFLFYFIFGGRTEPFCLSYDVKEVEKN